MTEAYRIAARGRGRASRLSQGAMPGCVRDDIPQSGPAFFAWHSCFLNYSKNSAKLTANAADGWRYEQ